VQVKLKDFKEWAKGITDRLRRTTEQVAKDHGRPLVYMPKASASKEDCARRIAARDGIREGLICILSALEPCWSYTIYRNRKTRWLELYPGPGKCLHYYHYYLHPRLGLLHIRLQTWLPLTMHIGLNGREWLCRRLDQEGIGYQRRENCLIQVEDIGAAQGLLDAQLRTDWPALLNELKCLANPMDDQLLGGPPVDYYWSLEQSEWASDLLFRDPQRLGQWYPRLLRHGITALGGRDVMRFLGRKLPSVGTGTFAGEVVSDLRQRPEGTRIKHRVNDNSIKMYDKQRSVLRIETTINQPGDFKVFRTKEGDAGGIKQWRPMRKGVADLARRAEVSQAANDRYLQSLATIEDTQNLGELTQPLCRRVRWKKRWVRGLNPLAPEDARLLEAVAAGEFTLLGFRNRDLRQRLYAAADDAQTTRRHSAAITRQLRILRAHGLIHKLPHTHRYRLTEKGRTAIHTLLTAKQADLKRLTA
jgi:hypothetical protein